MYPVNLVTCFTLLAIRAICVRCVCVIDDVDIKCVNDTIVGISSAPKQYLYTSLAVENTALEILPENAFTYANLEKLSVTACGVTTVHRRAFSNLRYLVDVDLTGNEIEYLHSTTFANNRRLRTLSVRSNKLQYVHPSLFEPTRWLTTLDLSFNRFDVFNLFRLKRPHRLTALSVESSSIHDILSYISVPYSVKHLSFKNNALTTIKESYFERFGQVVVLDLSFNRIASIDETAFRNLSNVEKLLMNVNHITRLPPRLFENATRLRELNLDGNALKTLEISCFDRVARLEILSLRRNYIDTIVRSNRTDSSISGLATLDLSQNRIRVLPPHAFEGLDRLKYLSLSECYVRDFDDDTFASNVALETLDLTRNAIESIPSKTFSVLSSLKHLRLTPETGYGLLDLPVDVFDGLVSLETLELVKKRLGYSNLDLYRSLTRLESLTISTNVTTPNTDPDIEHLPRLKRLSITGYNHDISVDTGYIFNLRALENVELIRVALKLTHENITEIKIRHLNIDECALIGGLPDFTFEEMHELSYLRIAHTRLRHVKWEWFASLKNLHVLIVTGCGVEYITNDAKVSLDSLLELDLSDNVISSITDVLYGLNSLRRLSIRWNNVTQLPADTLSGSLIESLDVSMNSLAHVAVDFFDDASVARFDFYGNPWRCACLDDVYDAVYAYGVEYRTFGFLDGELPACVIDAGDACDRSGGVDVDVETVEFARRAKGYVDVDDKEFRSTRRHGG